MESQKEKPLVDNTTYIKHRDSLRDVTPYEDPKRRMVYVDTNIGYVTQSELSKMERDEKKQEIKNLIRTKYMHDLTFWDKLYLKFG